YPVPPGASDIPGLEVAGEIIGGDLAHADNTFGLKIGDKVCALVQGGGYADLCVAPIAQCLPYPKGFTDVEAASLPETFFTVWSNVFQRGHLSAGETLLVQGGSSGIGVTAIMLAKALGHKVFVTAGSDEKCKACLDLGADLAINYKTQDFVEEVKKATNGKGVDVILDMVTGTYLQREIDCLADDGRIVVIAIMGGSKAEVNTAQILRRRLSITGSTLRPRPVAFKHQIAKELYQSVWPLLNSGQLKPVIYKTFSLEQAADAHRLMESSEHVGKIVLTV
ncbi:MAG: NAD(P)H-quinone oxidoreductase, partial [Burkholderiaceae bacterium]|nr:NAD(P)H-quinone oxidoreductase [Burkholderiaceae bacterium]